MKFFNKLAAFCLVAVLSVTMTSCEDYIDVNIDPNNPLDASLDLLTTGAEVNFAYVLGGDFGRISTIWMQQHGGAERQHTAYDVYRVTETDTNNAWNTMYASVIEELLIIISKAEENDSPHYSGVAKIMLANVMGVMVDAFGDIPFSEAGQGAENLTPAYDDDAAIYNDIMTLLSEGVAEINAAESIFAPGSEDLIYGGNLSSWEAYAYTLMARYNLHLSEVNGNSAYQAALDAIDNGAIASNGGNAFVPFGAAANEANPWQQFESERGDVVVGAFIVDLMNANDDPRRAQYFTLNGDGVYAGMVAGVPDNGPGVSRFGSYYASANSPIPLATYAETKFIEAEAALMTGDASRAAAAYNEAVAASLAQVGVSDQDFLDNVADEDDQSISLETIMNQKYVAMYTQFEAYNDWRRTGLPNLQPAQGETQIATRFPLPRNERLYNSENYATSGGLDVFGTVFWDQ